MMAGQERSMAESGGPKTSLSCLAGGGVAGSHGNTRQQRWLTVVRRRLERPGQQQVRGRTGPGSSRPEGRQARVAAGGSGLPVAEAKLLLPFWFCFSQFFLILNFTVDLFLCLVSDYLL